MEIVMVYPYAIRAPIIGALMLASASCAAVAGEVNCQGPASDPYFQAYKCPGFAQAVYEAKTSVFRDPSAQIYLSNVLDKIHAPSVVYLIGAEMTAELDPTLGKRLGMKMLGNREFHDEIITGSVGVLNNILKPFLEERRNNIENDTIDPSGEMAAIFGGLANSGRSFAIPSAAKAGESDAYRWISMAESDPDLALFFYRQIQTIVNQI
jgi:hypothetical protein